MRCLYIRTKKIGLLGQFPTHLLALVANHEIAPPRARASRMQAHIVFRGRVHLHCKISLVKDTTGKSAAAQSQRLGEELT
jgi:hypothetical protein